MTQPINIALCGTPNCGKTELFNALTGSTQRVGNWPGVTVDKKTGHYHHQQQRINVTDLPGIYSLKQCGEIQAVDATIACQYLAHETPDILINVVDASQLKRQFFLTAQLSEHSIPMVIVVNMLDLAAKKKIHLELEQLSQQLGCPVIGMIAKRKQGVQALKEAIAEQATTPRPSKRICHWPTQSSDPEDLVEARVYRLAADQLYESVTAPTEPPAKQKFQLDRLVLSRLWGIPIFLAVMYLMFVFSINVGGAFQDFFDLASDTIFVGGVAQLLHALHAPQWLIAILANGLGKGINTVLSFIPVIAAMFLFLALLEDSGYLSRAAFVMDRLMQKLGLPGQSFIPMIIGFGCNVPAVMAARALPQSRDRVLTIMMTPFISCGARLAIFAVFASAFFPKGGQNVIFILYLTSIIAAITTGFVLRKTLLPGKAVPLIMELPDYHFPTFRSLRQLVWRRLKGFVSRAGRYIVPVCLLVGALDAIHFSDDHHTSSTTPLAWISQKITPVLSPIGIQPDNWPATVGLVTGVLAKEVVVGTLNTLYLETHDVENYQFVGGLKAALTSIPNNLSHLNEAFANPFLASIADHDMDDSSIHAMIKRFGSPLAAFCYLLFVLLYFPCISTLAVMRREIPREWSWFSMIWTTGLAYAVATCVYQFGEFQHKILANLTWLTGFVLFFTLLLRSVLYFQQRGHFKLPSAIQSANKSACFGCETGCDAKK